MVGGCDIVNQSCELSRHPHFVIATPGRFAYLLRQHKSHENSQLNDEIPMKKLKYLVLDEADQLLTQHSGFEKDIAEILLHVNSNDIKSQVLLFSATMTVSLERLSKIAGGSELVKVVIKEDHKEDEEVVSTKLPAGLVQEYVFMPSHVRDTYVVATLQQLVQNGGKKVDDEEEHKKKRRKNKRQQKAEFNKLLKDESDNEQKARSVILFCSTCERTAHLSTLLSQLHISNLPLHSLMSQQQRYASLAQFKSRHVPILVSTDVASRGLDIPTVDLVLNVELPLKGIDYIHRVGRTARAGRRGRAISFVSETDIQILHSIEALTKIKLKECCDVNEKEDVIPLLNTVSKASRMAKMKLLDMGFDELAKKVKERKRGEKKAREKVRGLVRKQLLKDS